ncbi:hypothetical protein B9T33_05225 [Acinetobacter sp. ANC 5054]|nr:hypothetical protein B9T33_05225 [Acinetobacter sp. ANC 5054]
MEQSFACAPHIPQDVFIARFQSDTTNQLNTPNSVVDLSAENFIFRSSLDEFRYSKPTEWQSSFPIKKIAKDQLIIGLAYAPDGTNANEYQIVSFATLNCENDRVNISKPVAPFLAWNKQTSNCMHRNNETVEILDGFIEHDQDYYLAKIQEKYPTCEKLREAFPSSSVENKEHTSSSVFKVLWEKLIKWLKFWL